jgi:diadenylate cyclase
MEQKEQASKEELSNMTFDFMDVLRIFSPGTSIRVALDDILRARMGALIVINKEGVVNIIDGGFKVNCKFTPQRLVELAKMDGAIILSEDLRKVIYANTLLIPNSKLPTKETGTRHKAAERTAQQLGAIVVAISERKNKITVYWKDNKYVLEESSEVLRKAAETLQILEKQKDIFDELILHLNIVELTNLVSKSDICNILQRIEIIERISEKVRRYLVELGKEGVIVSMRLKELTKNLMREKEMILKDYFKDNWANVERILEEMNFDSLLENSDLLRELFGESYDSSISPIGWRILTKTNLSEKDVYLMMSYFNNISSIFDASREALIGIFNDENIANNILKTLDSLREKIISGKKI